MAESQTTERCHCKAFFGSETTCNVCKPGGFKAALLAAETVYVWVPNWNKKSSAYARITKKEVREIMKTIEGRDKDPIPAIWQFRSGYKSTLYFGG